MGIAFPVVKYCSPQSTIWEQAVVAMVVFVCTLALQQNRQRMLLELMQKNQGLQNPLSKVKHSNVEAEFYPPSGKENEKNPPLKVVHRRE